MPMKKLNNFLRFLAKDGGWHSLGEVAESTQLSEHNVKEITKFFAEFNFIQLNNFKNKGLVRIDPELGEVIVQEEG